MPAVSTKHWIVDAGLTPSQMRDKLAPGDEDWYAVHMGHRGGPLNADDVQAIRRRVAYAACEAVLALVRVGNDGDAWQSWGEPREAYADAHVTVTVPKGIRPQFVMDAITLTIPIRRLAPLAGDDAARRDQRVSDAYLGLFVVSEAEDEAQQASSVVWRKFRADGTGSDLADLRATEAALA